ncbi:MAG: hypothetical protein K2X00_19070 [Nitrospiraceae bacterium]|nr:hypothetical protein [Nitrospiraceae bacterium]
MREKSPQNREELAARFAKILRRKPTAEELAELDMDRQEHGLGYYDPVLVQLMSFKRERGELDQRLNGLNQILHRHEQTMQKQLEEARDQVLKDTDRRMVQQSKELVAAGMSELKAALEEEKKRLVELHRKELVAAVKSSTKEAVAGKFNETWLEQWNGLMKQFSKDWNEQVEPGIGRINGALQGAWKTAWVCLAVALLLVGALGGWWAGKRYGAPEPSPPSPPQTQPAKPSVPNRK